MRREVALAVISQLVQQKRAEQAVVSARPSDERLRERILADLFGPQRAFVEDTSDRKAALCTRRAGKTFGVGRYLSMEGNTGKPGDCLYLAPTRVDAKKLLWDGPDGLLAINREYGLDMKPDNSELKMTCSNGSRIYISGADKEQDIEKHRGPPYKLAVIDEPASFRPHLEMLVRDVLEPATLDHLGTIALTGTPGRNLAGLFYDVTRNDTPASRLQRAKGWAVHEWSVRDNPHLPGAATFIARQMERNGWTESTPTYLREYCGIWAREDSSLVYRFNPAKNTYTELPKDLAWEYLLGIDLGYDDDTALREIAFSWDAPGVYLTRSYKRKGMLPDDLARVVKEWDAERKYLSIVADTGGLGKTIVLEMNERHGLSIKPAEKTNKVDYIQHFNNDLAAGRIQVPEGDPVITEWNTLQWAPDPTGKGRFIEDPRFDNHDSDATLYVWREALHYLYEAPNIAPLQGTTEAHRATEKRIIEQLEEKFAPQQEDSEWWEQ